MKFTIENVNEKTTRTIDTPLTFKAWISIHYGAWGFYGITQVDKKTYYITDKFTGEITDIIHK